MQFIYLSVLLKRIKAIKYFMKDKEVPKRKKLIIILGFLYLISPLNLMQIPVFFVAWIDDVLLWSFIIFYLKDELDKYWLPKDDTVPPEKKFHGKTIINGVEFKEEEVDPNGKHSDEK